MSLSRRKWVIWYAIALHFVWGVCLLFSPDPLGVTAIHTFGGALPHRWLGALFIGVAVFAAVEMMAQRWGFWWLMLLIPQQAVLMLSAWGALHAISTSRFADGVPRPPLFILCDQLPAVLAAVFHSAALIEVMFHHKK